MTFDKHSSSLLEVIFVFGCLTAAYFGVLGTIAASLGLLYVRPVFLLALAGSGFSTHKLIGLPGRIIHQSELFVWLLLPLMALLFFPPHEYIFGGRDPGVYIALGAGYAKNHSLHFTDPAIASLSEQDRNDFFRLRGPEKNEQVGDSYRKNRQFPGLFVTDIDLGSVVPQFYPLYPVLLSAGYDIGGIQGELLISPIIPILALLAVYFSIRRITDPTRAAITMALLTVSYPIIWYSRYPGSELTAMLFIAGSGYFLSRALDHRSWPSITLSGLMILAAFFARIDTILVVVPLSLVALAKPDMTIRPFIRRFAILGGLALMGGILQGVLFSWPYFSHVVLGDNLHKLPVVLTVPFIPFGVLILRSKFDNNDSAAQQFFRHFVHTYGRLIKQFMGMALFIFILTWQTIGFLVPSQSDFANLFKLEWYLTPPVVLIGIWGIWKLLTNRWHDIVVRYVIGFGLFTLLFYLYKARVTQIHPWWVRRFLPVAIPALMFGFVWMIEYWSLRMRSFLRYFSYIFIAAIYLAMSSLMARFVLFDDALIFLDQLDGQFPAEVTILADDHWGVLATPLTYLYGRDVLPLNPDPPQQAQQDALVRMAREKANVWYYSFPQTGVGIEPPSEYYVKTAEFIYSARGYQSWETLPLAPGEESVMPVYLYRTYYKELNHDSGTDSFVHEHMF